MLTENVFYLDERLLVISVASEETVALQRLRRSAEINQLEFKVLGMGQPWRGLGQKIWFLRQELDQYKDDSWTIVLFVDAYDALINAPMSQIVGAFKSLDAKVLFSAEHNCWPDATLCPK